MSRKCLEKFLGWFHGLRIKFMDDIWIYVMSIDERQEKHHGTYMIISQELLKNWEGCSKNAVFILSIEKDEKFQKTLKLQKNVRLKLY